MNLLDREEKRIAVIGGGASTVALLTNLADQVSRPPRHDGQDPRRLRERLARCVVHIIERASQVAPGVAYCHASDEMILNTDPDTMWLTHKGEFEAWLIARGQSAACVPRKIFAQFLRCKLEDAVERLRRTGIGVRFTRAEVRSVEPTGRGYRIQTRDQGEVTAELLVLAVGAAHLAPYECLRSSERCATLEELEGSCARYRGEPEVVVLGTGQSAIDAALLLARCTQARIIMVSRSGRLPLVRGTPKVYSNHVLTGDRTRLSLDEFLALLNDELARADASPEPPPGARAPALASIASRSFHESVEAARREPLGWQAVMKNITWQLQEIYQGFSEAERALFTGATLPGLRRLRGAIPLRNAEKIARLIDEGRVRVEGGVRDVRESERADGLDVTCDLGQIKADYLVNATGFSSRADAHPLVRTMRFLRLNPLGGLKVDVRTMRVATSGEAEGHACYCLGALSQGDFVITNSMEVCAKQARLAAASLLEAAVTSNASNHQQRAAS